MELKSFATQLYLDGRATILDAVVSGKDVPVAVLEEELSPVEFSVSEMAEALASDGYLDYLRRTIPVGLVKTGEKQFDVSGDIPDVVLDVVEKLHGLSRDELVRGLIRGVMNELHVDKEIAISDVVFTDSPTEVVPIVHVEQPKAVVQPVVEAAVEVDTVEVVPEPDFGVLDVTVPEDTFVDVDFDGFDPYEYVSDEADDEDDDVVEGDDDELEEMDDSGQQLKEVYDIVVDAIKDRGLHENMHIKAVS